MIILRRVDNQAVEFQNLSIECSQNCMEPSLLQIVPLSEAKGPGESQREQQGG